MNLIVNEGKTQHATVKRGTKEQESSGRNFIKLGSKLSDREDVQRRRGFASTAMS